MRRKVIATPYDSDGMLIEGNFKDSVIGDAETYEEAVALAISKGFLLVDFDCPDHIPGELIGEEIDAFAIGVIST
jgi:hypothetical protein